MNTASDNPAPETKRVLIVEDDEAIASGVTLNLKLQGFNSHTIGDGDLAVEEILKTNPDLVLLDITLPGKSGLEVLAETREAGDTTPIIVLSARQGEYDKVAALRLGADDYVTKPFGVAELLARIDAVLRRTDQHQRVSDATDDSVGADLEFSNVTINLDTRQVLRGGAVVPLTHLEFELLTFMAQNASKVFERRQLLQRVWGVEHSGSTRTVDNFIRQLRGKLEEDPNQPRHIVTVRGSGYRFDP